MVPRLERTQDVVHFNLADDTELRLLRKDLESKTSHLNATTTELRRLENKIVEIEQEKRNLAERLFETEMNLDMVKEQQDTVAHKLEEALNINHELRMQQASRGSPIDSATQHGLLKQIADLRAENDGLRRRSVNQSDDGLVSAESNYMDDRYEGSTQLNDKLQSLTRENEELKQKSDLLSQQLIDVMAMTSSSPADMDHLRSENKALRQSLEEMNKQLMSTMTESSPASTTNSGTKAPAHANHQLQMLKLENQGLQGEIKRLKTMLEHLDDDSSHQSNTRYTPIGHKMLEDQIELLTQENMKLKSENAKNAVVSDKVKQMEERSAAAREEASNLKTRVFYLEDQIRSLHSQQVEKDRAHDTLVQRLREQVKSGDTRSPTNFSVSQSPHLGPSSTRQAENRSPDGGSSDLAREKRALESSLAKAERDLRTKDSQIADLLTQMTSLNVEIDRLRKEVSGKAALSYSDRGSAGEIQRLRERISILEDRERNLMEAEVGKEKRIKHLEDQLAKVEGDDSLKFE